MLREETFTGRTEFYQLSGGIKVVYSRSRQQLLEFTFHGQEIQPEQLFTVGMAEYHFDNIEDFLHISRAEVEKHGATRMIATSCRDIVEEWMSRQELIRVPEEPRVIILE